MKAIIKSRKIPRELKVISKNNRDNKLKLENWKWYSRDNLIIIKESWWSRKKSKPLEIIEVWWEKINMENVKINLIIKWLEEKAERLDKENQELYNENKILNTRKIELIRNELWLIKKIMSLKIDKWIYQWLFYFISIILIIIIWIY